MQSECQPYISLGISIQLNVFLFSGYILKRQCIVLTTYMVGVVNGALAR
jgi:hypothetical protein